VRSKEWKNCLAGSKPPADLDSLLRLVDVADHYKAPRREIVALLKAAAQDRQHSSDQASLALAHDKSRAASYVRLRLACDAARFSSEAIVLNRLAAGLKNSKPDLYQGRTLLDS
jgi:hypothetical protein